MEGNRGARRRRIVERGSDRLALITGQIRTLSWDSDSNLLDVDSHSGTPSCPPLVSQAQSPSSATAPSQTYDSPQSEDKASGLFPPNHDSVPETNRQSTGGDGVVTFTHKREVSSLDLDGKGPSVEVPSEVQTPLVPSSNKVSEVQTPRVPSSNKVQHLEQVQNPRVPISNKVQRLEPLAYLRSIIPFDEIRSAISESEGTRTLCSVAVAILVVLAYVGFPILGSRFIKSIIFFRPLYFLLLTNITMVVARVLEKQGSLQRPELQPTGTPSDGEHDFADQLGTALDLGGFLLSATRALFMCCTFYAITLVCGLSLAQSLGW